MNEKVIALHEVGHFIALCAVGLYDEFMSITCRPSNYNGAMVYGLTLRNGNSLTAYSQHLLADSKNYQAIIEQEGKEVVLKNLCFFFGGGSIDRMNGNESAERNSIDDVNNKVMCLPAISVTDIQDEQYAKLQSIVDEFLHPIFMAHSELINTLVDALFDKGSFTKAEMDKFVGEQHLALPQKSESFNNLLKQFSEIKMMDKDKL